MLSLVLFRIAAALLAIGTLGHTFGGMFGTAKHGPVGSQEATRVFNDMRSVRFKWQGSECTWFGFWMGNGLCVSAFFLLTIAILLVLGSTAAPVPGALVLLAWVTFACLALVAGISFKYFGKTVGLVFALIAALTGLGAALMNAETVPTAWLA